MSRDKRDQYLKEYADFHNLYRARGDAQRGISMDDAKRLRDEARIKYFDLLPILEMSRCPICAEVFVSQFDPWGFDGFWWQKRKSGLAKKTAGCEHFRVLAGAVNLMGSAPKGGKAEAHIGPDVPYVIPAVLNLPSMVAVISSIEMVSNMISYPIVYFSTETPSPGTLTATWRNTSYNFKTQEGKRAWTIKNDPWDFDLAPWIAKGKVRWITPNDPNMQIAKSGMLKCPFVNLPGKQRPQIIVGDELCLNPLPDPENDPDPFSL